MPKARLGRMIEATGCVACLAGLVAAFGLTLANGPVARWFSEPFQYLGSQPDMRFTATMTGVICLLPGLGLMSLGSRLAGPAGFSQQLVASLTARRPMTSARRLAVLVSLLIAAICLVALASLWPDIASQIR